MRSFTVISATTSTGRSKGVKNLGGRYIADTPGEAVKKAASKICGMSAIKGRCTLNIQIQETTQGSAKKIYEYKVSRILDPVTVDFKGVGEITFNYRTEVKRVKID